MALSVSNMALFGSIEKVMTHEADIQRQMADAGSESDISDSDAESDVEDGPSRKKQRKSMNGSESLNRESCSTKPNDSVILISEMTIVAKMKQALILATLKYRI